MLKRKSKPQSLDCLNCGTSYTGWFCPQCGQKSQTRRLTLAAVVKDFIDAISDSDKGFLKTVIDLSQNPKEMLTDYLSGKRQRYLSAGKYTFFLVVVFTVNISYLEKHIGFFESITNQVDELSLTQSGDYLYLSDEDQQKKLVESDSRAGVINEGNKVHVNFDVMGVKVDKRASKKEFLEFLKVLLPKYHKSLFDSLKVLIILWIPVFALFTALFFRKKGFNFAEHLTINAYLYSHLLLIFVLLSPTYWLVPGLSGTTFLTSLVACGFYLGYAYIDVFIEGRYRLVKATLLISSALSTYLMILVVLVAWQVFMIGIRNIDKL